MAVFGQAQSRTGLAAVYDAYTTPEPQPQSKQHQQQHSNVHQAQYPHHHHIQPQQQQQQQQQPWYDVSDGAVTPPDETASHRDSRMTSPTISARRINCYVTAVAALEVFIIAVMATMEYLLRMTDIFPVHLTAFSCYDPNISSKGAQADNAFSLLTAASSGSREAIVLVCVCFPPLFMAVSELILWTTTTHCDQIGVTFNENCRLSLSFRRIIRFTGTYVFGLLSAMLLTDTIKLMTGRLRPNFLDVCQPNITLCSSYPANTLHQAADVCTQTSIKLLQHARTSFPSMQASLTVYAAFFTAIYAHNVVCCGRKVNILRPFLALLFVFMSLICCLASYVVQQSHLTDLVAGFAIGFLLAVYLAVLVLNCFTEPLSPSRLYTRLDRALGLMHCAIDDLDSSTHGDGKSRSSSSSAGTEWRCADSTSARSWSHYAVHHLTPLHPAVATHGGGLSHKVIE